MTDMDAAEQARELYECPDCGFYFDAMHTDEDGSHSCPLCVDIPEAREEGRQAGLEEGARAARSVRPGAIMVPSVSNIWHNGVRAAARAIEALKDKPEGGQ